jgi:hypothetical protein
MKYNLTASNNLPSLRTSVGRVRNKKPLFRSDDSTEQGRDGIQTEKTVENEDNENSKKT